jgi:hypothetical protein
VATAPITTDANPCRTSSDRLRLRRLELACVDQPLIEAPAQGSGISASLTRQLAPPALVLDEPSCYLQAKRGPSRTTVNRLHANSGNRCAYPGCGRPLFHLETGACISNVNHIKGNQPGSARYDPNQTTEERHGYDNLILMCLDHCRVIDHKPTLDRFTTEVLLGWKATHEASISVTTPTTDAIVDALMGQTTGVSTQDAAIMESVWQHNLKAAFASATSTVAPSMGPVTLQEPEDKTPP